MSFMLRTNENPTALDKEEREKVQEIVKLIKQEIKELELRNTSASLML